MDQIAQVPEKPQAAALPSNPLVTSPAPEDPKDPTAPNDPTDLKDPTAPRDPKDPTAPNNPTDPKDPTAPNDLTDPNDPTDPTDPKDPKDPTAPTDPKDPTAPNDLTDPNNPTDPKAPTVPTTPTASEAPEEDEFLGPPECLQKKFTRASCSLVFCPPWERCIEGRCSCKPPYLCPDGGGEPVCGLDHRTYRSYCQVARPKFTSRVDPVSGVVTVFLPDSGSLGGGENLLVCRKLWNMAAANAACKNEGNLLGAATADLYLITPDADKDYPNQCVSVRCQGYETSLAECVIYNKQQRFKRVAMATCHKASPCGFTCANKKCVSLDQTCNGVDDCGDRSDEMCCKKCRNRSFRCRTGVCVPEEAVGDGELDCLDGADESQKQPPKRCPITGLIKCVCVCSETRVDRAHMETSLYCGIPNATTVDDEQVEDRVGGRYRRVVGGVPANPTQIQWQIALVENRKVDCGGAYIGGCWVLTAAHCVRPNPSAYKLKFSLWRKFRAQGTTDIVPVEDVRIHPGYNANTYENDIALVKLQKLPFMDKCVEDNPAISAVCVPWSEQVFQPNHTCSISGWGRTADGRAAQVLLWANVSLIADCQRFYKDRFKLGMMCAGDLDGSVDSCQGDSGGPLVCKDELGVSYLWGIVSWGDKCGHPGFPGVYTQVAHYFEWIRLHTGWPAVTKFNS
uniref:trypsin n=1 Tax=Cyclopterus lumpus TaxID=8103 RepID=A0A8C2ZW79_CYCLU